jgi:cytoskeletal protein CcmA (bactofilin family)
MTNTIAKAPDASEEGITTILADDLEIQGTMKFKSSLMIKGILEGEIVSEGLLIVGSTAKVTATITTKNLVSHGEIQGDVTASEQVILKSTAVHNGNITTPNVVIESGSVFNGSCIMKR